MPKMQIKKSIIIDKKVTDVFQLLSDFSKWTPWSPWLITDPEAKVTVAPDKKSYAWAGPVTGEGNMKIISEKENEQIEIDLTFLKPFKSKAVTAFKLKPSGNGTEVIWSMDSKLPFFLFWMKNLMNALVGMDYERGLGMLKEYAEKGEVNSKLDIKGNGQYNGCKYIGIKVDTSIENLKESMPANFQKLIEHMNDKQDAMGGNPFSIYHKWDAVKKAVSYTAAIPVSKDIDLAKGMIKGEVPATNVFTVHHTGPYHYAGNAWSAQYGRKQAKIFKVNKKIDPIEEYLNNPMNTEPNKLESAIHFPVK